MTILVALIGIGIVVFIVRQPIIEAVSPMPTDLGVRDDGQLKACPNKPNCVSTQAPESDNLHHFPPLTFDGSVTTAHDALRDIVESMPRSTLITNEETYLHAELRSPTMGFIDDLEIYIDEESGMIHMRSAARLGQSDMGANRRYLEHIQKEFENRDASA